LRLYPRWLFQHGPYQAALRALHWSLKPPFCGWWNRLIGRFLRQEGYQSGWKCQLWQGGRALLLKAGEASHLGQALVFWESNACAPWLSLRNEAKILGNERFRYLGVDQNTFLQGPSPCQGIPHHPRFLITASRKLTVTYCRFSATSANLERA
jgi:hypothetical protein